MKTKLNVNGDVHIPKIMRDNLNLRNGQDINIVCEENKIIITNSKQMRTRSEIKSFLSSIKDYNDDISKGMKTMAEWILYDDFVEENNE